MKLQSQLKAPVFKTTDIYGTPFSLADARGKKVLLTFFRNAGCPVCNLHFHEMQKQADYFRSKDMVWIAVYESSAPVLREYTEGEILYPLIIADPGQSLYRLYHVERSMMKLMKGMFYGAAIKAIKGMKLFKKTIKQDGNTDRMEAEFLIDENGKLQIAHYAGYLGDFLKPEVLRNALEQRNLSISA